MLRDDVDAVRMAEKAIIGDSYLELKVKTKTCAIKGLSVLFVGERGVGKELFADLYAAAAKRDIEKINCAGFNDEMLGAELFGHRKGAFTGATQHRKGVLPSSKGKVVFLDEIGDASERMQAKMLRVLRIGDYRPVGSDTTSRVEDMLFIAATNKPQRLREDLKDRFNVLLPIHRPYDSDISRLIQHSLSQHAGIEGIMAGALAQLYFYPWPGNVAEIQNAISEMVVHKKSGGPLMHHPDYTMDDSGEPIPIPVSEEEEDALLGRVPHTLYPCHLPGRFFMASARSDELAPFYQSDDVIPIGSVHNYCEDSLPDRTVYPAWELALEEFRSKEQTAALLSVEGVENGIVSTMLRLPMAKALEELEKIYYVVNAADPHIKTQKALALKAGMSASNLSKRIRKLGIQEEMKVRLRLTE